MAKMKAKQQEHEEQAPLETETLTGDLRDALMARIHNLRKPWQQMSEGEQRDLVSDIADFTEDLVARAVQLVAAEGRPVMVGQLDKVTVKDGFQAVIKIAQTEEMRHEMIDSVGQPVLLIVADRQKFTGEQAPYPIDADQPGFLDEAA